MSVDRRAVLLARLRTEAFVRIARARGVTVRTGEGVRFYEGHPRMQGRGEIAFGDFARIHGGNNRTVLFAAAGARIEFGRLAGINHSAMIMAMKAVEIGENSLIGPGSVIYDSSLHPLEEGASIKCAPVRIGDNVWVGHGAIILPGVTIGDHAVIGAASVITRDVPPRTLMAGNPAKPVRELSASDSWRRP